MIDVTRAACLKLTENLNHNESLNWSWYLEQHLPYMKKKLFGLAFPKTNLSFELNQSLYMGSYKLY